MSTKRIVPVLEKNLGPLTFGAFLKAGRTAQGKTQSDMAKFLKITKSTLCDIEKGRQGVSPKLAAQIARKLGFSEELAVETSIRDFLRKSGFEFKRLEISGLRKVG